MRRSRREAPRAPLAAFVLLIAAIAATHALAEGKKAVAVAGFVDVESGAAFAGYNDVQISGRAGTRLSFTDDLTSDPTYFLRVRLGMTIAERHNILALWAPLTIQASGKLPRDVNFDGRDYADGERVRGTYRFDSYRLGYRYDFVLTDSWTVGAGVMAKIRDAAVALDGENRAEKRNTGFVPLITFLAEWRFAKRWALLLDFDGLVGPQGRAEDALLAFRASVTDGIDLRFGYRILEGGADNDEVYNFTLVHFASAGITAHF